VTDESLNTVPSVEAGRLLAEIRVAPSRPLSFLTVRLIQRGETTLAQEL
jgi:phage tail sheath protein FI